MAWIALLMGAFIAVGLRDRTKADSTHLTIIVVTAVVLAVVFALPEVNP
jgi:hypothetical protein